MSSARTSCNTVSVRARSRSARIRAPPRAPVSDGSVSVISASRTRFRQSVPEPARRQGRRLNHVQHLARWAQKPVSSLQSRSGGSSPQLFPRDSAPMHPLIASLFAALLQFAVGSLLATAVSDARGQVTPGFLRLAAVSALCGLALAWPLLGSAEPIERTTALALLVVTLAYTVLQFTSRRRLRLGLGWFSLALGALAIVLAAVARPSPSLGP